MADEYQVIYEYSAGNTLSFKTNDLNITYNRLFMSITLRPDGKMYVNDPNKAQRVFTFSAIISGDDMNTLNTVQTGSITYSGAYPRIQKIYFDGDTTITNVEVAITALQTRDLGNGWWTVQITMTEKTD